MKRLLFSFAFLVAASGMIHAEDWPQWLGPNRVGEWKETGLVDTFPAGGPKVLWRAKAGTGYAGPAVANGKVIVPGWEMAPGEKLGGVFSRTKVAGTEFVTCFDEKTGQQLWQHRYSAPYSISYAAGPRCTPTIDGERVYTLGAMGDLLCLDVAKGTVIWSKNFVTDYESPVPLWGFAAHPLVDGDKLICLAGGSDNRLVVAFDKKTGKELWTSLSCPGDFGYCPPVIYEFGGKRQLIIWHSRAVAGLDPETGKKLWDVPFEVKAALTAPMPRKAGDNLFITSFYNGSLLLKVGASGAEVVWKSSARGERPDQTTDLSSIMPTPVLKDGYVYGVCSYGQLRCLELATGKRIWDTMEATRGHLTPERVRANPEPSTTQPWIERWANAFLIPMGGDRFVLFNEQGELILADLTPKGYTERSRTVLIPPTNKMSGRAVVWMHPAFANKCVFARNDEELICVSLAK